MIVMKIKIQATIIIHVTLMAVYKDWIDFHSCRRRVRSLALEVPTRDISGKAKTPPAKGRNLGLNSPKARPPASDSARPIGSQHWQMGQDSAWTYHCCHSSPLLLVCFVVYLPVFVLSALFLLWSLLLSRIFWHMRPGIFILKIWNLSGHLWLPSFDKRPRSGSIFFLPEFHWWRSKTVFLYSTIQSLNQLNALKSLFTDL